MKKTVKLTTKMIAGTITGYLVTVCIDGRVVECKSIASCMAAKMRVYQFVKMGYTEVGE